MSYQAAVSRRSDFSYQLELPSSNLAAHVIGSYIASEGSKTIAMKEGRKEGRTDSLDPTIMDSDRKTQEKP